MRTVNARHAAVCWLNAFLASGSDDTRPMLYRTLSVEFFDAGVQFIGCDGTLLFRTFCAVDGKAQMPLLEEAPDRAVVVMDTDRFALAFMRTLLSAATDELPVDLAIAIEAADESTASLGEVFAAERPTLRALGQELHCKLYDSPFPDWRKLKFGLDKIEVVEGMTLAPRMFATVGKLRGMTAVDCEFHGATKQIDIHGRGEFEMRGLMMPTRR